MNDATTQKEKGKLIEGISRTDSMGEQEADPKKCLDTLDIFAGCGGLSEGLQKSGITSFQLHQRSVCFRKPWSVITEMHMHLMYLQVLQRQNGQLSTRNLQDKHLTLIILMRLRLLAIAM